MSTLPYRPRIGIVIPVYKHAVLVGEAINSILAQIGNCQGIAVVVNDGCPYSETARLIQTMAQAYPSNIISLHTPNGGLSAARNRGIQLLLESYPSIEGIFFLDADNRIEPCSFEIFEDLLDNDPDADWFYPQFDMFGINCNVSYGGPWSLLMHTADNMCEAGSLVRRRVFDSGVRFDESMKLGYEDWEFWFSAARMGFRGRAVEKSFFQYRKRPESMLSSSHRLDGEIRSFLRRKHAWLFNARTITAIEHVEAPRIRVLMADSDRILSLTDPLRPTRAMSHEDFGYEVWHCLVSPAEASAGAFWIVTTEAAWSALEKSGLLRFALWDLERRLGRTSLSTILLEPSKEGEWAYETPTSEGLAHFQATMVAIGFMKIREIILDESTLWIDKLNNSSESQIFSHRFIRADGFNSLPQTKNGLAVGHFREVIMTLRSSRYRKSLNIKWEWRSLFYQFRDKAGHVAREAADAGILYPFAATPHDKLSICFLVPIAQFGGSETVALQVAAAMRRSGWRTALCIIGTNPIRLADRIELGFDEVMWFPEPCLHEWSGPMYQGTHLVRTADGDLGRDLIGLLASFDCVIGCHPVGAISILATLRKHGVITALHEHVLETNPFGRHHGPPMLALAHEAAVDVIVTCSNQLSEWLNASGVPNEKLIPLPNVAGYHISETDRLKYINARKKSSYKRPLRALFLGRLDYQKGLDRLVKVIQVMKSADIEIEWRVVGKAIIKDLNNGLSGIETLLTVEDPVYTPELRSELYAWADVVLLPSRYEGLPLTVFEAQRLGAVPIMTKVGAYTEAIEDGYNGILVNEENCVEEIIAVLTRLVAERGWLYDLSKGASSQLKTWDMTAAPFIDRMEKEVARVRKSRLHSISFS